MAEKIEEILLLDGSKVKPGGLVQLRSGGPLMTVNAFALDQTEWVIWCIWWNDARAEISSQPFLPVVLRSHASAA